MDDAEADLVTNVDLSDEKGHSASCSSLLAVVLDVR